MPVKSPLPRPDRLLPIGSAFAALLIALTFGCAKPLPPSTFKLEYSGPSIAGIVANYTNYSKMTEGHVAVNPELAMLCRGATQAEVEAARIKYGPHANAAILIYMNGRAARAFREGVIPYPTGAVIVKEKMLGGYITSDGGLSHDALDGVGGMVKRAAGFDPAHGDWEYFYFDDKKKIESGPISSCIKCHESAKSGDYVFGAWRKAPETAQFP